MPTESVFILNRSEARDVVRCVFCLCQDRTLKFLTCTHCACAPCLKDKSIILCPKCHTATDPREGLHTLSPNYLKEPLETLTKLQEPNLCVLCDSLGKETSSTHVCLECQGEPLCKACVATHRCMTATKYHKPVERKSLFKSNTAIGKTLQTPGTTNPVCPDHAGCTYDFICMTCAQTICRECFVGAHAQHRCVTVSDAANSSRNDMKGKQQELLKDIASISSKCRSEEKHLHDMKVSADLSMQNIRQRTNELIKKIRDIEEGCIAAVQADYKEKSKPRLAKKEELENLCIRAKQIQFTVEASRRLCPDIVLVDRHEFLREILHKLHLEAGRFTYSFSPELSLTLNWPDELSTEDGLKTAFGDLFDPSVHNSDEEDYTLSSNGCLMRQKGTQSQTQTQTYRYDRVGKGTPPRQWSLADTLPIQFAPGGQHKHHNRAISPKDINAPTLQQQNTPSGSPRQPKSPGSPPSPKSPGSLSSPKSPGSPSSPKSPGSPREQKLDIYIGSLAASAAASHWYQMESVAHVQLREYSTITGLDVTTGGEFCVVGTMKTGLSPRINIVANEGQIKPPIHFDEDLSVSNDLKTSGSCFYMADLTRRQVVRVNRAGVKIQHFQLPSEESGTKSPLGLAVGTNGDLYVSSVATKAIYRAEASDTQLAPHMSSGLSMPFCMCLTPSDDVITTEYHSCAVSGYASDKTLLFTYNLARSPFGVCTDSVGNIYIADCGNDRVTVLSSCGELLLHLLDEAQHGIKAPKFVAVDAHGKNVAVAHSENFLSIFTPDLG